MVIEDDAAVEGGIQLSWVDNTETGIAAATDQLRIVAMCEDETTILQGLEVNRDAQLANVLLPYDAGVEAHVFAIFENAEKNKYSTDQQGTVNIT